MRRLQPVALSIAAMLLLGFGRSGLATGRLYRELFNKPPVNGSAATIDAYVGPLKLTSADELRQAVKRSHWEGAGDVSMIVDPTFFSPEERSQLHFATSYLLYPARVFSRSLEDVVALRSAGHTPQQVIVAGPSNPFPGAAVEEISSVLRLVTLP